MVSLLNKPIAPTLLLLPLIYMGLLSSSVTAADERVMTREWQQEQEQRQQVRYNLVKAVQRALTDAGYNPGPVDGIEGSKTSAALEDYQRDKQLTVDGVIGTETLESLGLM